LALFFSIFIAENLEAATYYIDGSKGKDSNPGSPALSWKTISKANSTLQAGDTVYLRAGTYTNEQIKPSNSGTSGNYITYQNYSSESVILSEHKVPLYLYKNDYIKIDGFRMQNSNIFFALTGGANHNIIQNCTFYNARGYFGSLFAARYVDPHTGAGGDYINTPNNYNQILNNVYEDAPSRCSGPDRNCETAPADAFIIKSGSYNLIQGNTFGNTSHDGLCFSGKKTKNNVVRNNLFRNTYRRGINLYHGACQNLVENNTFYDQGLNMTQSPSRGSRTGVAWNPPAVQCAKLSHKNIFRRNTFDNNGTIFATSGKYNVFYHNTANKQYRTTCCDGGDYHGDGDVTHNKWKNNIFANTQLLGFQAAEKDSWVYNWCLYTQPGYLIKNNIVTHNAFTGATTTRWRWQHSRDSFEGWEDRSSELYDNIWNVDPGFVDANNRDFTLQGNSQVIDAGAWLTTITSSTASGMSSFTVDDAGYFYDGWGIPGGTGDVIKTAGGKVTTIQSINYDTNTLTVSPAIDIVQGEGLTLNYSGKAPDIGAYEYHGISVPRKVRVKDLIAGDIHAGAQLNGS
jgi:hypothetical protein